MILFFLYISIFESFNLSLTFFYKVLFILKVTNNFLLREKEREFIIIFRFVYFSRRCNVFQRRGKQADIRITTIFPEFYFTLRHGDRRSPQASFWYGLWSIQAKGLHPERQCICRDFVSYLDHRFSQFLPHGKHNYHHGEWNCKNDF